jgi:hypothetical protein
VLDSSDQWIDSKEADIINIDREFMAQIQALQDQNAELQAQLEGDEVEGELCS